MSRTFGILLTASLLIVVSLVWYAVSANQNHLVTLKGSVLKVRTLPLTKDATLVLVDFRISNPSKAPFDVKTIELEMDRKNPEIDPKTKLPIPTEGGLVAQIDLDRVFDYEKKIGPRENPNLVSGDRINPGQSVDRMIAARIELPQADVESRARLRIRIHEFEGLIAEFLELHPATETH